MAHISTGVEYGVHCLLHLAGPPAGVGDASVRDLAQIQGVSVEYLAKLFTKLQRAGLVVATEGARGGFALAHSPERISVLDIMTAIDGRKPLFDCRNIRTGCAVFGGKAPRWASTGVCSVHAVMLEAEKHMRESLARHSLADLAGRVVGKAPAKYGEEITGWFKARRAR
jgi:Rrf2 family protein